MGTTRQLNISDLPDELLFYIFTFLSDCELSFISLRAPSDGVKKVFGHSLLNVQLVSHKWCNLGRKALREIKTLRGIHPNNNWEYFARHCNQITNVGLVEISVGVLLTTPPPFSKLRRVSLRDCKFDSKSIPDLFHRNPKLSEFDLDGTYQYYSPTTLVHQLFMCCANADFLTHLTISNLSLTGIEWHPDLIRRIPHLYYLSLSNLVDVESMWIESQSLIHLKISEVPNTKKLNIECPSLLYLVIEFAQDWLEVDQLICECPSLQELSVVSIVPLKSISTLKIHTGKLCRMLLSMKTENDEMNKIFQTLCCLDGVYELSLVSCSTRFPLVINSKYLKHLLLDICEFSSLEVRSPNLKNFVHNNGLKCFSSERILIEAESIDLISIHAAPFPQTTLVKVFEKKMYGNPLSRLFSVRAGSVKKIEMLCRDWGRFGSECPLVPVEHLIIDVEREIGQLTLSNLILDSFYLLAKRISSLKVLETIFKSENSFKNLIMALVRSEILHTFVAEATFAIESVDGNSVLKEFEIEHKKWLTK